MTAPSHGARSLISNAVMECRRRLQNTRKNRVREEQQALNNIKDSLSESQRFLVNICSGASKGVSSWLMSSPGVANGTVLNRSDFRDAITIRYGLQLDGQSPNCVCGKAMTVDHAMTCPCGGYSSARHNEVRDPLAVVMRGVVQDVEVEPKLLPYQEEQLQGVTANRSVEAHVDIRARGFWTRQQEAFFR